MSTVEPTPWYAIPTYAEILARDGTTRLTVGVRDSATVVHIVSPEGLAGTFPIDPAAVVNRIVPSETDALVSLFITFPEAEVLPS